MLLLVNDQQTKPPKIHCLSEQRMRADDDIDRAAFEILLYLRQFFSCNQARRLRDLDRQTLEAFGKRLEVLAGKQRSRHHDGDLESVHRDNKRGAQSDLRLAEADVAAHQTIHGAA